MRLTPGTELQPRKQPRQARSQVTVDAVYEATIQVLLDTGAQRLTTTLVAERAGVSVGTLYQYFPNKQSLLFATLQRHLEIVAQQVESAALGAHHQPIAAMVAIVVEAFVQAKTEHIDEARALYRVASELDATHLVQAVSERSCDTIAQMLQTAPDARFADPATVAFVFSSGMIGPVRALLEHGASPRSVRALRTHLEMLCLGYLLQCRA